MGCWNATCQVSQLPIRAGEKVRFLLLVEGIRGRSRGEACHSTEFYTPYLVPVRAEYNDYGSVENVDTDCLNFKFWGEQFAEHIVEKEVGENEYHDVPVKKNMKLEELLSALQEGRVAVKAYNRSRNSADVVQTMIREDVYQSLLQLKHPGSWRKTEYSPTTIYQDALSAVAEENNLFFKFNALHSRKDATSEEKVDLMVAMSLNKEKDYENAFCSGLMHYEGDRGMEYYINKVRRSAADGMSVRDKAFKTFLKDISDFIYIKNLYDTLRFTWHPGSGCGSQSAEWKMAKDYHLAIADVAKNIIKKHKEEYGE